MYEVQYFIYTMIAKVFAIAALACVLASVADAQYVAYAPSYGYPAAYYGGYAAYPAYAGYAGYPAYYAWGSNKGGNPGPQGAAPQGDAPRSGILNNLNN